MNIEFATNRLSSASLNLTLSTRLFGAQIGRKYIQRLSVIRAVDVFNQLYELRALRFHALRGGRAGQYSMSLTGNYRLVIERVGEDTIRILAVEDYHGN